MPDDDISGSSPEASIVPSQDGPVSDVTPAADPSPADAEGEPSSMIDAVVAALHPKKDGADPPSAETEGQDTPQTPKDDDPLPEEVSEEELRDQKPRTARRIRQLLDKVSERDTAISGLKPKAEALDQLSSFMQQSGVSVDDLNAGIEIMSLIRRDPRAALEKLTPTITALQQFAGQVLPADLQERVRLGYLDEASARELAQLRNSERFTAQRAEESRRQQEAEAQQRAAEGFRNTVETTGNEWQRSKMSSDPDWAAKAPRVLELIELEVGRLGRAGKPPTAPQDVVAVCEKAYSQATTELKKHTPSPKPVKAPTDGSSSQSAVAEPKSMLDVIRNSLQATRAA